MEEEARFFMRINAFYVSCYVSVFYASKTFDVSNACVSFVYVLFACDNHPISECD